ncbi:hypothetical protein AVEN_244377-1, partial [Araneus ventricosus]
IQWEVPAISKTADVQRPEQCTVPCPSKYSCCNGISGNRAWTAFCLNSTVPCPSNCRCNGTRIGMDKCPVWNISALVHPTGKKPGCNGIRIGHVGRRSVLEHAQLSHVHL